MTSNNTSSGPADSAVTELGFVGLGNMGLPMARNLVAAGFTVTGADLDPLKVQALVDVGGLGAPDARAAARGREVVLTSLPGPNHVHAVADEIVSVMEPGSIWIDLSTNDLACARYVAELAARHGIEVLDAPVTGGIEGARAATLGVLVGGDPGVHARAAPVLSAIGARYDLLGSHGAGYVAKIAQVMLCYLNSVCLTEALMLGVKGGVDPTAMLEIIQTSTGRSYVADRYGPEILNGTYDPSFDLTLAVKDLRLATELAADVGASIGFTDRIYAHYVAAEHQFGAGAPHLMAVRSIEEANDLILGDHSGSEDHSKCGD